jgi:hypothetical protein
MPNSVKGMGCSCLSNCSALTKLEVPNSVKKIGDYCFGNCRSLTDVTLPKDIEFIGGFCFFACRSLRSVKLPSQLKSLSEGCFFKCQNLQEIIVPNSVSFIGERCFNGCHSLRQIRIPDSVKQISDACFKYCTELTQLVLPDSVESIGDECFSSCHALRSIDLPIHLTACLNRALFFHCVSLEEIRVGELTNVFKNTNKIGARCFEGCKFLEKIHFPSNVSIDDIETTFSGCIRLKELGLLDLEERIKKGAIKCTAQNIFPIFCTVESSPLYPPTLEVISTVIIPPSVCKLPGKSFFNCRSITRVLFLSMEVECLGNDCFNGCLSLELINLPERIWRIGDGCFSDCYNLYLPCLKLTSYDVFIGRNAFKNCISVQSFSLSRSPNATYFPDSFKGTEMLGSGY